MIKTFLAVATLLLGGSALIGQAQTVCGGLNHLTITAQPYTLNAGLRVGVLFVPATTLQVERLQWYFPTSNSGGVIGINSGQGTVEIRANDALTGLPSGTILASASFGATPVISVAGGWQGGTFSSPVVLQAGVACWLTYTRAPANGNATLGVQNSPAGPDLTPASIESGGTWGPVSFNDQFKVRVTSTSCSPPGPVASWTSVGSGCAGTGPAAPTLTGLGLPILGSATASLTIAGAPAASPYGLFWSSSASPVGIPLGGGCNLHLEHTSFTTLLSLGLNPLMTGTLDPAGTAVVSLPVPNDPLLLGATAAFQVAVIVPYGVPSGSINFVVTEAQVAMIGY